MKKVAVLGAGSFGITLADVLKSNSHDVFLWEYDSAVCAELNENREEKNKLPGVKIHDEIIITDDPEKALSDAAIVVCAVPTRFIRQTARLIKDIFPSDALLVNVSKGIENDTMKRISEIFKEEVPAIADNNFVALSGPSHAEEVSRKIPTAIVAASVSKDSAVTVQKAFNTPFLRVYVNDDVTGVELAGSLKNIIAVAAGIADGMGFGDNTKGAILTRGMFEIARLGLKLGSRLETFSGLTGVGDIITTSISTHSRNRYVGEALGKGESIDSIMQRMPMVAEGIYTVKSAYQLAGREKIEMPITTELYRIVFEGADPRESVSNLMLRDLKSEGL
ncbi:MAG: NAD(P)H-dependent glycerol-3-phosphate dehydrogenase [Fibrobacterota bacterium]